MRILAVANKVEPAIRTWPPEGALVKSERYGVQHIDFSVNFPAIPRFEKRKEVLGGAIRWPSEWDMQLRSPSGIRWPDCFPSCAYLFKGKQSSYGISMPALYNFENPDYRKQDTR